MGRYRYRTRVLVGPWRETRDAAALDAIRSRQARPAETGKGLVWLVPGDIEADAEARTIRGEKGEESSGNIFGG